MYNNLYNDLHENHAGMMNTDGNQYRNSEILENTWKEARDQFFQQCSWVLILSHFSTALNMFCYLEALILDSFLRQYSKWFHRQQVDNAV